MLIDTHCHLASFARKGELETVLDRAAEADVGRLITIGTSVEDWLLYRDLARQHAGRIDYTVGLHPTDVGDDWADQVAQVATYFADDPPPVALGEVGLDHFHLPKYPDEAAEIKARQAEAFRQQLQIALQLDCPVVVHSRNAFQPCLDLVQEVGVNPQRVVFHCFADGPEEIRALNAVGARGSFTGIITYPKSAAIRDAAQAQGMERLMLETDAPYLAPQAFRGKPNEPAYLRETATAVAGLFGVTPAEVAEVSFNNALAFFKID